MALNHVGAFASQVWFETEILKSPSMDVSTWNLDNPATSAVRRLNRKITTPGTHKKNVLGILCERGLELYSTIQYDSIMQLDK